MKPKYLVTIILLAAASMLLGADWPQYRGPQQDGSSPERGLLKQWPSDGPKEIWKTPLTDGFSSFAVADGKAFTLVQRTIEGVNREVCIALHANTGKEIWARPLGIAKYDGGGNSGGPGDGPRSTPSFDAGRVYVLSAYLQLACLDANSGNELWSRDLTKEAGGQLIMWQSAASPLIDGDLIFVMGGGPGQALLGLDKRDGKTLWKGQNDKMTHDTPTPSTILGTRQIIFFTQNGLVSVQPQTGEVLWRFKFPYSTSTAASPIAAGDIVYCSAGYGVGAAAAKITKAGGEWTATELWRSPGNNICNHWSTPVHHDGYLYGLFSFKKFKTGPLKCVELATGKEMWSEPDFGAGNLILVDGHLLVLGDQGQLVLVEPSPSAYKEIARTKALDGKCWSTPVVSNGRIYARSVKEAVCLDVSAKTAAK
jgi:outer membrane protein assembly factor BamB